MSELGLVLCGCCRHEKRRHAKRVTGPMRTQPCQQRVLEHGTDRLRQCRCLRFTEAPFEAQQVPLIAPTADEVAQRIYAAIKEVSGLRTPLPDPARSDTAQAQLSLLP